MVVFWLPPIVNQQAPAEQVFSKQLSPTVTISNLCSGAVVRTFSGSDVQLDDGQYHANWHTPDDYLDPACTYRIAITAGARQLGVADLGVVDNGSQLKNVDTGELIPLLDGQTLPIKFFIGIGSQCQRVDSDCGEGTAQPGANTTIVTKHGPAGVFIPAGAVDNPVTIIIESSDDRPCIAGLLEPVFSGSIGPIGNSCYDIHTEPPLAEVNASGKFNTKVTVGICAETGALDHATRDLLQIFQLHLGAGGVSTIFALNNTPAPFLSCDPAYPQLLGSERSVLGKLAAGLRSLVVPKPLFASTTTALDVGAGGQTEVFSRFTWALPSVLDLNFDQAPDLLAILPGTVLNSLYSRVGVTFSRTSPLLSLCPGNAVYANDHGLLGFGSGQNNISVCPLGIASDFSQYLSGVIKATFTIPAVEVCINATPRGYRGLFAPSGGVAFIEARDLDPNQLGEVERYIANFPELPPKLAAQGFIVVNFMAYFLLIPAMVPMAIATQSVIGEKQARSLEPQLATPIEVGELLAGKALAAATPAVLATWAVFVGYGLVNGAIADPRLTALIFNDVWRVAMLSLVPLICLMSVLLGMLVSSRVNDPRTAQQIGGFVVIPVIAVAVAQFFGGQATFSMQQVLVGDLVVLVLIGLALVVGNWAFDREAILTRLG